jgi:two-component system, sensor histidine kinase YesM
MLPFLILGAIWYESSSRTIESNAVRITQQLIKQTNKHVDFYLTDLERSTFPLLTHPLVQQFIKTNPNEKYEQFKITQKIENELFPNFVFGRDDIFGVSLISENGMEINDYNYERINLKYVRERNKKLLNQVSESDNFSILGIQWIDSVPVLTVSRKVFNMSNYQTAGLLIIDLNLNQISSICKNNNLGKSGFVWILDSTGQVIYHPNKEKWGQELPKNYFQESKFNTSKNNFFIQNTSTIKKLINFHQSEVTNWVMVSEVPLSEINSNLISLRNMTILVGIFIIGLALTSIVGFSFSLTNSLYSLQKTMKKVELGNLDISVKTTRKDEIGSLYSGFNKMVKEIKRLIEVVHLSKLKEKELELKNREATLQALQAQINPHFLYNTLELINSHAIVEDSMTISRMATSLADMFRYSVKNDKHVVVQLNEELEHVRSYLEIQTERFKEIEVYIQINNFPFSHVRTVRLTLQPIIENAFIHGYEKHKIKPEYIGITGEAQDAYYVIRILDKGRGMDSNKRELYNKAFKYEGDNQILEDYDSSKTFNRIGMWNVHHRIRLQFGKPYGLFIEKSDSNGTIIEIRLPYKESEGDEDVYYFNG